MPPTCLPEGATVALSAVFLELQVGYPRYYSGVPNGSFPTVTRQAADSVRGNDSCNACNSTHSSCIRYCTRVWIASIAANVAQALAFRHPTPRERGCGGRGKREELHKLRSSLRGNLSNPTHR